MASWEVCEWLALIYMSIKYKLMETEFKSVNQTPKKSTLFISAETSTSEKVTWWCCFICFWTTLFLCIVYFCDFHEIRYNKKIIRIFKLDVSGLKNEAGKTIIWIHNW